MDESIPLSQRRFDWLVIAFFIINLGFITYIVDLEQLVISDPNHFVYPIWPPAPLIDLVHAYAHQFDPLVLARTIILAEETFGPTKSPHLWVVYLDNAPWLLMPIAIITRMCLNEHPFTRVKLAEKAAIVAEV